MSNEIKVGDWTITREAITELHSCHATANWLREKMSRETRRCCECFGIDPTTDTIARDICEEIVLHGTPVDEVVAKLQRHLEGGQ